MGFTRLNCRSHGPSLCRPLPRRRPFPRMQQPWHDFTHTPQPAPAPPRGDSGVAKAGIGLETLSKQPHPSGPL